MLAAVIVAIVLVNLRCGYVLARDLWQHRLQLRQEPGRPLWQGLNAGVLFFLSAFGISDFAICTALYSKTGWAEPRKLPGTLNAQCVLPVLVYALVYLSAVAVDITTLLPCLIALSAGAYLSPKLAVRLPVRRIRQILTAGLFLAGTSIVVNKLGLMQISGEAFGLSGPKLVIATLCFFCIGALKAMGVGSYPLTMAVAFFLGLNPLVCYPLMMGGGALASPMAALRYIKLDHYMRRLTFLGCTVGLVGALIAVFIVKSLSTAVLQWVVVAVIFYAAVDMLLRLRRERLLAESERAQA